MARRSSYYLTPQVVVFPIPLPSTINDLDKDIYELKEKIRGAVSELDLTRANISKCSQKLMQVLDPTTRGKLEVQKRWLETRKRDIDAQLQEYSDKLEIYEKDRVMEVHKHDRNHNHDLTEDMNRIQLADMLLDLHNAQTKVRAITERIEELRRSLHLL